jgi:protein TonB
MTRHLIRSRLATIGLVAAGLVMAAVMLPAPALHAQYDEGLGGYSSKTPRLTNPTVVKSVKPTYTAEAKRKKIEGTLTMEGVVTVDGALDNLRITKSLDRVYGLDDEALKAARLWTFRPGTLGGKPVPVVVTVEMSFKLH